jgi:Rps23 Pro-64 3,4-dihydroxylase Tpa1-like proline 4-hydroxylase
MKFIKKSKLKEAIQNKEKFLSALPFPHMVIDDFFNEKKLNKLLSLYPGIADKKWWVYSNPLEMKFAFNNLSELDPIFQEFFDELNSKEFVKFISKFSELENIVTDPSLYGGGLHQITKGGKLDVHEDFNIHRQLKAFRKINIIVYLNKDWKESYGGDLQIWNADMTKCEKSVLPVFNRIVIFRTDMNSNHGHPDPLQCPEEMSRKSLAIYYYVPCTDDDLNSYVSTAYKKIVGKDEDPIIEKLREDRKKGRLENKTSQ